MFQITDTHLMATASDSLLGVNTDNTVQAIFDQVRARSGPGDLGLLSGDLAQEPSPSAYRRLGEYAAAAGPEWLYLPGNHDELDVMRQHLSNDAVLYRPQTLRSGWQLLCLDSTVPGHAGGNLRESELAFLEQALEEYPNEPALVALHHFPLPLNSRWLDTMVLANADRFFEILDKHSQVRVVITGHVHQEHHSQRGHYQMLATPSTCFQFKPESENFSLDSKPPGYRWLNLNPDGSFETAVEYLDGAPVGLLVAAGGY